MIVVFDKARTLCKCKDPKGHRLEEIVDSGILKAWRLHHELKDDHHHQNDCLVES